jgi:hypothetical protein
MNENMQISFICGFINPTIVFILAILKLWGEGEEDIVLNEVPHCKPLSIYTNTRS